MPRVGPFRELDRATLTPFAQLIYDYLASQMPTMLVSELAAESGISNNAIWSWLKHGIIPRRATVVQLAERVPALASLDELLEAAGLPTTADMRRERMEHLALFHASIRETAAALESDPRFTPDERAIITRYLESLPASFVTDTDTWREWQHASPAMSEAEQSTDDAAVYHPAPISSAEEAHGQPGPPARPIHDRRRRHSQV